MTPAVFVRVFLFTIDFSVTPSASVMRTDGMVIVESATPRPAGGKLKLADLRVPLPISALNSLFGQQRIRVLRASLRIAGESRKTCVAPAAPSVADVAVQVIAEKLRLDVDGDVAESVCPRVLAANMNAPLHSCPERGQRGFRIRHDQDAVDADVAIA